MHFIGINEGHCSTAALISDGRIVACVSEERLTRIKNQHGFPRLAVAECLRLGGITADQVDGMILASAMAPPIVPDKDGYAAWSTEHSSTNWFSLLWKLRDFFKGWKAFDRFVATTFGPIVAKITTKQRIATASELSGIPESKISVVDHHLAHAMSAIFGSGWSDEDLLALTIDGEGDLLSATVGTWRAGKYVKIAQSYFTDSLGHFYSSITGILGMKRLEHEYKIMGLAPYATGPDVGKVRDLLAQEVKFDRDTLTFETSVHSHHFEKRLEKVLYRKRFDYISAGSQLLLEELLCDFVKAAVDKTGIRSVVAAGGTFMNIKANHEIVKMDCVDRFFVMPSCGDDSLAVGACYDAARLHETKHKPVAFENLYWGGEPDTSDLESKAQKLGFAIEKPQHIAARAAALLAEGNIVARCAGRMEFGARALGNRSILADPTKPGVVEKINRAIKHRDFWMPFAPVVAVEHAEELLADAHLLPKCNPSFMMMAFESTEKGRHDLAGGSHPYDKTLRPQVLKREQNPGYYDIIQEFAKITGRYGLMNTSFNIHGEPIVHTADDALHVLEDSGLTHVIIGEYIVSKKNA